VADPSRFALSEDHERLAEGARRIAREELAPLAASADPPGRVDRTLVRALADHRLLPRLFPQRAGGSASEEVPATELCVLREALALESTEAETALALQALGGYPILQSGSRELVAEWIPRVARGEAVAAFALSEQEHGSDAGALELRAVPDGEGWRLFGRKAWISNAPDAEVYAVFARTTEGAGSKGITAFAVPGDAPGLTGEPVELISRHPVGNLEFDGVPVDETQMLGEVDGGFRVAMRTLDLFRPSVGAFAVGMARAALELAVAHAGERRSFGKLLREHQAVSQLLGEMATRVEAARLLVYAAAAAVDADRADTMRSAMAKLFATETAQWVVDAAVQIHGARALETSHRLAHLYADVRAPRIYEGTTEIQREIVARELYR
jgi:acyl-CoA dehydrogenase